MTAGRPGCAACRAPLPELARFCPSCGAPAAADPAMNTEPLAEVRKTVSVLFCDLADSTKLGERLDAEALRALLLRYYELASGCLEWHGGTVEKFIGDAVVAVFGIPVVHEDDALHAVRAAVGLHARVAGLNEELMAAYGVRIEIRIGVNTGEIVTGGAGQSLVSGDTMNTAARLQQHAPVGGILVGEKTWRLVGGAVRGDRFPPLAVKGKAEPLTAFHLTDLGPPPDSPADLARGDVPLVGRDQEIRQFELVLERLAAERSCQVLTVLGEAGIGKSRLAREYLTIAGAAGAAVGAGRCAPYGEGASLHALAQALRQVFPANPAQAPGASLDPDLAEALAQIQAGLLRDDSPGQRSDQLGWALNQTLSWLAADRPLVLLLDDLQWGSKPLLDMLDLLLDWVAASSVLLICASRPELVEVHPTWGTARVSSTTMLLRPLGVDAAGRLATTFAETTMHGTLGLADLVDRAAGNPFHLEQLVAMAEDERADSLPPTVEALIAARLDLLEPAERTLLQCAAVVGREFDPDSLRALLGPDAARPRTLQALCRRRLAEQLHRGGGGAAYRFANSLIHEVTSRSTSKRQRARWHEVLADALQRDGRPVEKTGEHRERAVLLLAELGPPDAAARRLRARAADDLGAAGVQVLRRGDLAHGAGLLERSRRLAGDGAEINLWYVEQLAEARLLLGEADAAIAMLRSLEPDAAAAGDERVLAHVRLLLSLLDGESGLSAAEQAGLRALPVFEAAGDDLGIVRACLRIGQGRQGQGRYLASDQPIRRAVRHAVRAQAELELATALGAIALSLWLGPAPLPDAIGRCRALLAEHGGGRRAVRAAISCPLAVMYGATGDVAAAAELLDTAAQIIDELGHAYAAASIPVFRARVAGLSGHWAQAERLLRSARDGCAALGDHVSAEIAGLDLARVMIHLGRVERAEAFLPARTDGPLASAMDASIRARAFAVAGERDAAYRWADVAQAHAARTDSTECQATVLLDRANVALANGDRSGALQHAAAAQALFRGKGHTVGVGWAGQVMAG
jgi:class 3 adenylate cyclase